MNEGKCEHTGARRGSALRGVNVLELAWVMAGPISTKYLADNGATVVRVESMSRPDLLRAVEPYKDARKGPDRSGSFAFYAANKLDMALNLKHPRARPLVEKLVKWADIVIENWAPGKIREMGLGYEVLKEMNPGIIMIQVSIQGQTGPDCRHPGYGVLAAGLAGATGITGWPDRTPSTPVAGYTDLIVPPLAVVMLLAALDYRKRTGRGQCIDLNQFEATQQFLAAAVLDYTVNGRDTTRNGNFSPVAVPHNAYRCRGDDRWCVISVSTDEQWLALRRVIGRPGMASEPRFHSLMERKKNEAEINLLVQEWTMGLTPEEAVSRLQEAGVPSGVVQDARDMLHDPQMQRSFWLLEHSELGPFHHLGQAFTFSGHGGEPCTPAPCLGEHTEYVCRDLLHVPDDEFVEMLNAGVFE